MGAWFDARLRNGEWRFRRWSTVVDAYTTPELTEAEAREEMLLDYTGREILDGYAATDLEGRIDRAKSSGTTSRFAYCKRPDLTSAWTTERCQSCGRFHHEFKLRASDGRCADCGEASGDKAHAPACDGGTST